jgi:hypothetical protein
MDRVADAGRLEEVEDRPPSSLVLKEKIATKCPRVGFAVLNLGTGERFPGACKVYRCPRCGPVKASAYGQLAAASRPERFVTLTLAGDTWAEVRAHNQEFVRRLRRLEYDWQAFWAVEENPLLTGHHVHALQHGDYIPQAVLQDAWGAIVHIEAVSAHVEGAGQAARYVIKGTGAANYVTKGTTSDLGRHLALNGGRTAHWSRRYMRLESGDPVAAFALMTAMGRSAGPGPWLVVGPQESDQEMARLVTAHNSMTDRLRRPRIAEAGG